MAQEIAGYVAEYHMPSGSVLCYGYGETLVACTKSVDYQIGGATSAMKSRLWMRIESRPVDADEASAIVEMLEADVLRWEQTV